MVSQVRLVFRNPAASLHFASGTETNSKSVTFSASGKRVQKHQIQYSCFYYICGECGLATENLISRDH